MPPTATSASATYGWDKVPNRTSVQVGGGSTATTTYDAANRPTSGTNPTASYSSDDDGRLLSAPGNQYVWDKLGRLTQVKDAGGTTIAIRVGEPLHPSGTDPVAETADLRSRMAAMLEETIAAYPAAEQPPGSWWVPARLGGSAPTPEEAARLDEEEKRRRAERRAFRQAH